MKISELQNTALTDELVDRILFKDLEYYKNHFADVAVVLGSSKAHIYRLPPVIRAYKSGYVTKIITSGHTRIINGRYLNEGEFLKNKAIEEGVCVSDVFAETRAANTVENFKYSKEILQRKGMLKDGISIAVATSSYHMRRSLLIAEKVFEGHDINFISLPGEDVNTRRETWFSNENGRERCYGEIRRIIWSVSHGIIDDRDV